MSGGSKLFLANPSQECDNKINKLGLSCAKLRIVGLKIEDNKMLGLNENWGEKHKRQKMLDEKIMVGQVEL